MTTKTRYFVIASLLVLTVGIGTGLVAYYVGFQGIGRRGVYEELQFMPPDAAVVAYANVHDVMTSELRQRVRRLAPQQQENGQREFEGQTGINIETDIDRVVACFQARREGNKPGSGLVLARGRFNEVKIEALMRDHGAEVEDYKGKRVIITVAPDNNRLAVSFLEPGLVALGNAQLVRGAIDHGGDNVTKNRQLMDLVDSLDNPDAWAVGRFDALRSSATLPPEVAERLPAITWFSVTGHIDGGIRGVVRAEASNEEAAKDLGDVVRGFVALAKLQAGSNPQMQTMVQSLGLDVRDKTVALSFSVPAEIFDSLSAARPRPSPQPRH